MRNVNLSPKSSAAGAGRPARQVGAPITLDLCSTCNHEAACRLRKTHASPVMFCEEFDDHVAPPLKAAPRPSGTSHAEEGFMGLCMNCENRHACPKERTSAGIWHCEEYQ